jgi:hypothetical protein
MILSYISFLLVLSFYAKRKDERKGATNEKSIISFPCKPFPEPGPDMIDLASPSSLRSVHAVCGFANAPLKNFSCFKKQNTFSQNSLRPFKIEKTIMSLWISIISFKDFTKQPERKYVLISSR